jgi:YVTN family beta-propeller protein
MKTDLIFWLFKCARLEPVQEHFRAAPGLAERRWAAFVLEIRRVGAGLFQSFSAAFFFIAAIAGLPVDAQLVVADLPLDAPATVIAANPVTNKIYVALDYGQQYGSAIWVIDGATNASTYVTNLVAEPYAIAVNSLTNQIYVANQFGSTVTVIDGTTNATTTVPVGSKPEALAVNSVTNQIYVANNGSNSVTVIDGPTNETTTVPVGTGPEAVAVNSMTNQIYVANTGSDSVTVIDGATNATSTMVAGTTPAAIAVNPVTNQVYVANSGSNTVTVIDGATDATTTVAAGTSPEIIAVNSATNKVYVANADSSNVTEIDGLTNEPSNVVVGLPGTGSHPYGVAVNSSTNQIYVTTNEGMTVIDGATDLTTNIDAGGGPIALNSTTNRVYLCSGPSVAVIDGVALPPSNTIALGPIGSANYSSIAANWLTNKIYIANEDTNTVTVFDDVTSSTTTVAVGEMPWAIAVNPTTNTIFVVNLQGDSVTVIDGSTNATATVPVGVSPNQVAVNPITNQIYVTNYRSNSVTVIDGGSLATMTVAVGVNPGAIAVNSVTNKIYVANNGGGNVTVIDGATNATAAVPVGTYPSAVAVNPITNLIYVFNLGSASVTVIDGATNATTTVPVATRIGGQEAAGLISMLVNPVTNKVYFSGIAIPLIEIDGATNETTEVPGGGAAESFTLNSTTDQIYVVNSLGTVTVINGATYSANIGFVTTGVGLIAVNPATGTAYDANDDTSTLTVINWPVLLKQPVSQTISSGSTVVFAVSASGSSIYQWVYTPASGPPVALADGNGISGSSSSQLVIQGATGAAMGSYYCLVATANGFAQSNTANLAVSSSSNPGTLVNLSGRGFVGPGDGILIGGFYIGGSTSRTVLIQALGPALASEGVSGALQHPALTIHDATGATIYANTGWGSSPVLLNAAMAAYANPVLQPNSGDSEALLTLPPGGYTAEISGADGGTGVALCAIYELP